MEPDNLKRNTLKISEAEMKKVQLLRNGKNKSTVEPEWLFISKFGKHFGWGGIMAILKNEISMETANSLMAGADKIDAIHEYAAAQDVFIGAGSAASKTPSKTFKILTKSLRKGAEL